ncbi:uncharacterized protein BDZ99DRAFT_175902 [Mytilinidion resinicola]|uniref:Uncharacterized protein n=1 Tax=Mytilinidion resinicola TaxID=574789 RepID=A0A6A6Y5W4_9PEZI|nr:uncharacterized protein BDZ99DRAFT_175902 [Mytilinidion resinicola]KAF2803177.1 hypothetical protein BDZ99DRAFT_175902 [Mytilinidion resinicola]
MKSRVPKSKACDYWPTSPILASAFCSSPSLFAPSTFSIHTPRNRTWFRSVAGPALCCGFKPPSSLSPASTALYAMLILLMLLSLLAGRIFWAF